MDILWAQALLIHWRHIFSIDTFTTISSNSFCVLHLTLSKCFVKFHFVKIPRRSLRVLYEVLQRTCFHWTNRESVSSIYMHTCNENFRRNSKVKLNCLFSSLKRNMYTVHCIRRLATAFSYEHTVSWYGQTKWYFVALYTKKKDED